MKTKNITLLTTLLLTLASCSKTRTVHSNGQVIEIANWLYNKTALPISGVRVCVLQYSKGEFLGGSIQPTGKQLCAVTDAEGKFSIGMQVPRKEYHQYQYLTFIPEQPSLQTTITGMSNSGNTKNISDERGILTLGGYKYYPMVITLNNVNYLNDNDSLLLDGQGTNQSLSFTGKQNNTIIRGIFHGTKSSGTPTAVGGHIHCIEINKE